MLGPVTDGGRSMRSGRTRVLVGVTAVAGAAAVVLAVVAVALGVAGLGVAAALCLLVALAAGAGTIAGRRRSAPEHPPEQVSAPAAPAVLEIDDLPAFFDRPPGSPAALPPAPAVSPASVSPASVSPASVSPAAAAPTPPAGTADTPPPAAGNRRSAGLVVTAVVVGLVVLGVVAAVVVSTARTPRAEAVPTSSSPTASSPTATRPAAPLTAAAAGDLADLDLPPGDTGFTADLSWTAVVLEPRAVGVTVAYPELTVSGDGAQAVAHLDLAVWNCLADTAPADPAAADCRRSVPEYADLGSPQLQVTRTSDGLELAGTFATYTRPNGSAAAYTGRSYPVDVEVVRTPEGADGTLQLGSGTATVVPPGRLED